MDAFDSIVLSGGGSSGIAMLGALHYFYQKGELQYKDVRELAGASIGSVICLLFNCGYTPMELLGETCITEDFFDLKQTKNILHNIQNMGMISIDPFVKKVEELVRKKVGSSPTFLELFQKTKKKLYVSATDVSNLQEIKYCHETTPDMYCVDAIKQSCNIPIVFHRILYEGKYMTDGGVSNNYPWDYLSASSKKTLGLFITNSGGLFGSDNFMGYLYKTIVTPIKILSELRCNLAPSHIKTVKLHYHKKSSYLNLEGNQKMDCFVKGYKQAEECDSIQKIYVKGWNEKYIIDDDELWVDF